jgi:hypothetical protein
MAKSTTTPKKGAKSTKPSAQLIEGNTTKDIPVEEVPNPPAITPPATLTADQKATQEVQRFNVARAWIAEKKEAYAGLTIAGVEDKDGQKAVHTAWQEIRNKRLAVADKHTEIKADYLTITRAIDKEKNELTALLKEVEDPLKAELERIEAIKEEEKQKEIRQKAAKLQGRVTELLDNGMGFSGSYYTIGETISMDVVTLQNMSDADYATFLARVAKENEAIATAKAEAERLKKEEADRLEAQRVKQEEQKAELERQQKAIDDQKAEIEKQKKEARDARTKARGYMVEALGLIYNYATNEWQFKTVDCGIAQITRDAVEKLEGEEWEGWVNVLTDCVKNLKEAQAVKDEEKAKAKKEADEKAEKERTAAEEQRQRNATRKTEISALYGMTQQSDGSFKRHYDYKEIAPLLITQSQLENYNPEAWAAELENLKDCHAAGLKLQADAKALADAAAEQARQATLSDVERVNEYLAKFNAAFPALKPEIKDAKVLAAFEAFDRVVAGAIEDLSLALENIK